MLELIQSQLIDADLEVSTGDYLDDMAKEARKKFLREQKKIIKQKAYRLRKSFEHRNRRNEEDTPMWEYRKWRPPPPLPPTPLPPPPRRTVFGVLWNGIKSGARFVARSKMQGAAGWPCLEGPFDRMRGKEVEDDSDSEYETDSESEKEEDEEEG